MKTKQTEQQWHTPGPWFVGDQNSQQMTIDIIAHDDEGDELIASVPWADNTIAGKSGEANAALIAAAPSMYEFVASMAKSGDTEALKIMEGIHGNAKGN